MWFFARSRRLRRRDALTGGVCLCRQTPGPDLIETSSTQSRSFGWQKARQTAGEAVLNIPSGQCWPCNAAKRKTVLQQADSSGLTWGIGQRLNTACAARPSRTRRPHKNGLRRISPQPADAAGPGFTSARRNLRPPPCRWRSRCLRHRPCHQT